VLDLHQWVGSQLEGSQAAFLMAGYLFAGSERLPFSLPGDLPRGFGAAAGVPRAGKSVAKLRKTLVGVSFWAGSGFSQGNDSADLAGFSVDHGVLVLK